MSIGLIRKYCFVYRPTNLAVVAAAVVVGGNNSVEFEWTESQLTDKTTSEHGKQMQWGVGRVTDLSA